MGTVLRFVMNLCFLLDVLIVIYAPYLYLLRFKWYNLCEIVGKI